LASTPSATGITQIARTLQAFSRDRTRIIDVICYRHRPIELADPGTRRVARAARLAEARAI
jgi:hypothetical protein